MTTKTKNSAAANSIEDVAVQANETFEGIVKAGQEQASRQIEQAMAASKEQVEKVSQQVIKGLDDFARFSRQNVDTLVESGAIVAKGAEEVGKAVAALAQSSFDQNIATSKALLNVRSVGDLVTLQTSFAQVSFDILVTEGSRLSGLTFKVTHEALAPFSARVDAALEKLGRPAAL